jgi:hypothetical protein
MAPSYLFVCNLFGVSVAVSDYRLDDRASGVRCPAEIKIFYLACCVHTSSEAHPALGIRVLSRNNALPGRDADHSPQSGGGQELVGAIFPFPLVSCMAVAGQFYSFVIYLAVLFR